MRRAVCLLFLLLVGVAPVALADDFGTTIEMRAKGGGTTFYVSGHITGLGAVDWMVDTGSGYMTINEKMLLALQASGQVRFVKTLRGRLADGRELDVPVHAIDSVSIGDACWLRDVEVAVFPGNARPILGLNVLQRAAPFIFSFTPPRLQLSGCESAIATADAVRVGLAARPE